jgi:hypothetical protein
MSPRRLAGFAALCGTAVLVGWVAAGRPGFGSPGTPNTAAWSERSRATRGIAAAEPIDVAPTAMGKDAASTADVAINAALPDARPMPRSEIPPVHASLANTPDPTQGYSREEVAPQELPTSALAQKPASTDTSGLCTNERRKSTLSRYRSR